MDTSRIYSWLVLQGRIGLSLEGDRIALEVEAEGRELCVLTPKDTTEVCAILFELARAVWERNQAESIEYERVEAREDGVYSWSVPGGPLQIVPLVSPPGVGLKLADSNKCHLTAQTASEVIQILKQVCPSD